MSDHYDAADVLAVYTQDVARHPMLSREEEQEVGRRAMEGDADAQEALVRANLRFVITVAKRFRQHEVPLMDLIQAGNMGLYYAAKKFDPSMGNRFITYAIHWILQAIRKEIDSSKGTIRTTLTQMDRVRKVRREQAEARQRIGRELTVDELIERTGYTKARIQEALDYRPSIQSLDAPVNPADRNSATLSQVIGFDDGREEKEAEAALSEAVRTVMSEVCSPREYEILAEYFGFDDRRELSLTEIGAARGVTRERARQLKERGLKKIREAVDHHPLLLEHFTPLNRQAESHVPEDDELESWDVIDEDIDGNTDEEGVTAGSEAVVQGDFWGDDIGA